MRREDLEKSLFLTLDGLRGVGAILVVMSHNVAFWGFTMSAPIPFCVDLFFIMSGFILAFVYEPRFAEGMTALTFMRHRFVRLYPLYFIALLAGTVVMLAAAWGETDKMSALGLSFIPQLFMLPSPDFNGSGDLYPLNMPAWTLAFELWANMVFVLAWRWLRSTAVLAVVVALSFVVLAWCTISYGTLDQGSNWATAGGGFARAMFGFFVGVLVYRLLGAPRETPRKRSWVAVPALAVPVILCLAPQTPETRAYVELAIVCGAGPLLMLWLPRFQPPLWFARLFAWLGLMSFALYMVHYPIFELMKRVSASYPELYLSWTPWSGAGILLVSIIAATLAATVYDGPMRRYLNGAIKAASGRRKRMVAAE